MRCNDCDTTSIYPCFPSKICLVLYSHMTTPAITGFSIVGLILANLASGTPISRVHVLKLKNGKGNPPPPPCIRQHLPAATDFIRCQEPALRPALHIMFLLSKLCIALCFRIPHSILSHEVRLCTMAPPWGTLPRITHRCPWVGHSKRWDTIHDIP